MSLSEIIQKNERPLFQPTMSKEEYVAQKNAERQDMWDAINAQAEKTFESGVELQAHLLMQSHMPQISANNILYIKAQRPDATNVKTFDYWTSKGRRIIKDTKTLSIMAGEEFTRGDGSKDVSFKPVKGYFDISQTEGNTIPQNRPMARDRDALIVAFIVTLHDRGILIQTDPDISEIVGAHYQDGVVYIRDGMSDERNISSLAKVTVAALRDQHDYTPSQAIDYCAAYVFCEHVGLPIGDPTALPSILDVQADLFDSTAISMQSLETKDKRRFLSNVQKSAYECYKAVGHTMYVQRKAKEPAIPDEDGFGDLPYDSLPAEHTKVSQERER